MRVFRDSSSSETFVRCFRIVAVDWPLDGELKIMSGWIEARMLALRGDLVINYRVRVLSNN